MTVVKATQLIIMKIPLKKINYHENYLLACTVVLVVLFFLLFLCMASKLIGAMLNCDVNVN